jgi:hypothetical protein
MQWIFVHALYPHIFFLVQSQCRTVNQPPESILNFAPFTYMILQTTFWANVFWANVFLGKCLSRQMSFWANVFWANVFLSKWISGQTSSGKMSFWANVFLGQWFLGKCPSGQMSFWANFFGANVVLENVFWVNVFWANVFWANVVLENVFWVNVFWANVFWANVYLGKFFEQMSLGKCRMGKCRITLLCIYTRQRPGVRMLLNNKVFFLQKKECAVCNICLFIISSFVEISRRRRFSKSGKKVIFLFALPGMTYTLVRHLNAHTNKKSLDDNQFTYIKRFPFFQSV